MKSAVSSLLTVLFFCCATNADDINPCAAVDCITCHECKVNSQGEARCVYMSGCCPDPKTIMVNCFVSPCLPQTTQSKCPNATDCIADYCTGCNAHYYDQDLNEICTDGPATPEPTGHHPGLNPCRRRPCPNGKKCVPSPKQCFTTPCPQYDCV